MATNTALLRVVIRKTPARMPSHSLCCSQCLDNQCELPRLVSSSLRCTSCLLVLISGSFEHRLLRDPVSGQQVTTDCSCRSVFFQQLKPLVDGGLLEKVDEMREVGLYLHKRHIRGDHGKMLEQAGTVLQHTVVYIKTADKVRYIAKKLCDFCVHIAILPQCFLHC
jgi:hypothetical protein